MGVSNFRASLSLFQLSNHYKWLFCQVVTKCLCAGKVVSSLGLPPIFYMIFSRWLLGF